MFLGMNNTRLERKILIILDFENRFLPTYLPLCRQMRGYEPRRIEFWKYNFPFFLFLVVNYCPDSLYNVFFVDFRYLRICLNWIDILVWNFQRPLSKKAKIENIFVTRKVWCIIWYAQILGPVFFSTFWISTNREQIQTRAKTT